MKRRKSAKAAPGKPFKRGIDPRRNTQGARSKESCELTKLMRQAMTDAGLKEERFQTLANLIWEKAIKGVPLYVEKALEYSIGKPIQPVEQSGNIEVDAKMTIEVVHTK